MYMYLLELYKVYAEKLYPPKHHNSTVRGYLIVHKARNLGMG